MADPQLCSAQSHVAPHYNYFALRRFCWQGCDNFLHIILSCSKNLAASPGRPSCVGSARPLLFASMVRGAVTNFISCRRRTHLSILPLPQICSQELDLSGCQEMPGGRRKSAATRYPHSNLLVCSSLRAGRNIQTTDSDHQEAPLVLNGYL